MSFVLCFDVFVLSIWLYKLFFLFIGNKLKGVNLCESFIGMDGRWGEREETVFLFYERNFSFRISFIVVRYVLE